MTPEQMYIVTGIASGVIAISSMVIGSITLMLIWNYGDGDGK